MSKFDEMMVLLEDLEDKIFDKWVKEIPGICEISLAKTLLLVDLETRLLALNFDKEVISGDYL